MRASNGAHYAAMRAVRAVIFVANVTRRVSHALASFAERKIGARGREEPRVETSEVKRATDALESPSRKFPSCSAEYPSGYEYPKPNVLEGTPRFSPSRQSCLSLSLSLP